MDEIAESNFWWLNYRCSRLRNLDSEYNPLLCNRMGKIALSCADPNRGVSLLCVNWEAISRSVLYEGDVIVKANNCFLIQSEASVDVCVRHHKAPNTQYWGAYKAMCLKCIVCHLIRKLNLEKMCQSLQVVS